MYVCIMCALQTPTEESPRPQLSVSGQGAEAVSAAHLQYAQFQLFMQCFDTVGWASGSKLVCNKCIAVRKVATPLRELTWHMGSHSVTCHPTEVIFPPLPQPKLVLD